MFAFLGLGVGELLVLLVIAGMMAGGVVLVLALVRATSKPAGGADHVRELRIEVDRLREETDQLRAEVGRLSGGAAASADNG